MNRRKQIELTDDERRAYVAAAKTIILVSNGKDGYPHPMPMWFAVDDAGVIEMTTFGRSQKAVNLRRDPRVSLLVESGETYDQLQGVFIRGRAEVIQDVERCVATLVRIQTKHLGPLGPEVEPILRAQAQKRVVVRVTPERYASWDHRKLGGVY